MSVGGVRAPPGGRPRQHSWTHPFPSSRGRPDALRRSVQPDAVQVVRGDGHHLHGNPPPPPRRRSNGRWRSGHGGMFLFPPLQELEKLEVERIEWIQQHLRQYTTLRHETDMFNQSVSPASVRPTGPGPAQPGPARHCGSAALSSGGGTCGPAAAEGGPGKGPGAVGEGEQDRRGPTCGHGHIEDGPRPVSVATPTESQNIRMIRDAACWDHVWIRPPFRPEHQEGFSAGSGKRRQTSMFPRSHDIIVSTKSDYWSSFSDTASTNGSIFLFCMRRLLWRPTASL